MSFPSGLYTLRASPAAGYGGLYATGNGVDDVVAVAPQSPPFIERQVWKIEAVHGKESAYTISLHTNGSTFGGHWFPKDGEPIPEHPVVTSENSYEWFIAYKNIPDVPHIITIRAPNPRLGVDFYAGTNDKEQVSTLHSLMICFG
ncbi:clitocypin cysteine proteinase inhibitor [Laccaria bicolor S238N-H82]|uniref:Clitocypin cysteine proteinase inhibitor n=1 Tax=Laccaria bicolor (strain S238N-H82 / ATCC MYA-4686) TaxID=486041 RepID=B0D718_LACBS|nr:clitocypin cysteine proteinase inhibitor [Laccaria bicolor S238N-H82]EDR09321.1 clitocypin cysteine proteinase inhibitor [Laccaria bicolor S238N-H82]|eukprot:XP_001879670.1 clitocypin cysteine proteinase inhibitor [Laccaria bicolor S238N-H82]